MQRGTDAKRLLLVLARNRIGLRTVTVSIYGDDRIDVYPRTILVCKLLPLKPKSLAGDDRYGFLSLHEQPRAPKSSAERNDSQDKKGPNAHEVQLYEDIHTHEHDETRDT